MLCPWGRRNASFKSPRLPSDALGVSLVTLNPSEILVVDDDPIVCVFVRAALKKAGFSVSFAHSGESALRALEDHPTRFHAILLDRRMGGMDGLEVLRLIKKDEQLAALPVILQTARCTREEILEGLAEGAFYYLPKPVDTALLTHVIQTAVNDHLRYLKLREACKANMATLTLMHSARFHLKTMDEATRVSQLVAQGCPDPPTAALGLSELLINAIEHGNLEITFKEKGRFLSDNSLDQEIAQRSADPILGNRQVTLDLEREPSRVIFTIQDQGAGFDYQSFLDESVCAERLLENHGRGIFMAKALCFSKLEFQGKGNCVIAEISL